MDELTVSEAGIRSGWSPRMLRYLERFGLVSPRRTAAGYRLYGLRELNQLRALADLRQRHGVEISDVAFAARLRREPQLRRAVDAWLAGADDPQAAAGGLLSSRWVEWEQRKHERLLAA